MAASVGIAEIALTILCMLLASLTGLSVVPGQSNCPGKRGIWFFSTLISWICYSLAFYIIGVSFSPQPGAISEGSRDDRSLNLACSALLFVGLAISIVCRSIPDPLQHLSASYQQLAQMVFVLCWIISPWSIGPRRPFWSLLPALFLLWVARERSRLFSASSRSRTKEDLLISEYMAKRHGDGTGDPRECNYIVGFEVASTTWLSLLRVFFKLPTNFGMEVPLPRRAGKYISDLLGATSGAMANPVIRYDKLVTVQDIWKHIPPSVGGKTFNGRDVCLSFALFKLLRRRFRGCNLHESGLGKTRKFALQGLLSDPQNPPSSWSDPPNPFSSSFSSTTSSPRAFNIIEAELGFLFDFFYGNHFPDFHSFMFPVAFIVLTATLSFSYYYKHRDEHRTDGIHVIASDVTIFFMFPLLGIWQLLLGLSNWHKVNLLVHICRRRKRLSSRQGSTCAEDPAIMPVMIPERLVLAFLRGTRSTWSNQVRQYCLLLDDDCSHFATRRIPIKAKEALVNALVDALRHRDGVLSDGHSSLSRNGNHDELSWACRQEFVAEKIIVWHVATTLCHVGYALQSTENMRTKKDDDHEVATTLSVYCAYLVGFAPELIADDIYATRLVFDNACAAAMERVKGEGSLLRIRESAKSMTFGSSGIDFDAATELDVVSQGKMLAAQLLNLEDNVLWTVLADVWAELMLFISPADNAAAHLEKLKTGGELITHIWTLLTHAGILERPSTQRDYEANQTSQLRYSCPSDREEELV